ncbi:universal stress protein UspA [Haloprofundus marisrubri]|uniref:Universal stress protein UspA n=1 Tax=Haloprofundus marisrubri TaxID=1514971 RepID=A0A0W1RCS8_9EURY|nr:universal stress protein [Haloprofundus marisrubri]KTG10905.1 universal stress protein UspA [Haloprofundus marisrubri]
MYNRILVPVDGSDQSAAAVEHTLDLAEKYDADVHAVYVVDTGTNLLTVSKDEVRDTLRDLGEETAEGVLREVEGRVGDADADIDLVVDVLEGKPDEEILQYADEHGIDLVVMGTHGRTGVKRRLLGSVTERVIRDGDIPVLTVGGPSTS